MDLERDNKVGTLDKSILSNVKNFKLPSTEDSLLILMGLNYLNLDLYVGTIVSRTPGKTDTNVPGCT